MAWWDLPALLLIVAGFFGAIRLWVVNERRRERAKPALTVVHDDLGIQHSARDVQKALERWAVRVNVTTTKGLSKMLVAVAQKLHERQGAIRFGSARVLKNLERAQAKIEFDRWTDDARSKFGREVIRADKLGVRRQPKEATAGVGRDEDGQPNSYEFFVVSLIVAARQVSFPEELCDTRQLERILGVLASLKADQLEAVEVVWSPASRSDAMALDDMTKRYSALRPL